MKDALRNHWPEYLMEAAGLGLFMVSACLFSALLFYPDSPAVGAIPDAFVRGALIGIAMGLTAIAIIYSPWGKRSGAHLNPSVTLTFLRLGKVRPWDALFYIAAQFTGGLAGVLLAAALIGPPLAAPAVNYAATIPGSWGIGGAFLAEALIAFGLMATVLSVSNRRPGVARYTGLIAGCLVALYITFEAPLSGMSMNPARTTASAIPAGVWTAFWLYFTAPPLGMLAAAECYLRLKGAAAVRCAKLHHQNAYRCIFRCGYVPSLFPSPSREGEGWGEGGHSVRREARAMSRRAAA